MKNHCKSLLVGLFCVCFSSLVSAVDTFRNNLEMRFVLIPAGEFTMGTTEIEAARMEFPELKPDDVLDETPPHSVRITHPFYLGDTEVTQAAWYRVMENKPGDREFWQRAEHRNRNTAIQYDKLGLAEYEAMEAFVRWDNLTF